LESINQNGDLRQQWGVYANKGVQAKKKYFPVAIVISLTKLPI
jgi:hypothetical protein